ncbi:MAG: agmatine deiminase family protein [Planctomycetes bacterium]|nr:agmatine deiminase family protein [Planctomycetota bacterium]
MLPAVSFHVDFDLTIRAHGDKMIAFVNDSDRAVQIILELGIDALAVSGKLGSADATSAKAHLQAGRAGEFFDLVSPVLSAQTRADGSFGLSFARLFSSEPVDSPVGNLQRFLTALDLLASRTFTPKQLPSRRHFLGYMRSMQRRRNDRQALHQQLRDLGFDVQPVPSLAEADRSINYLNGLHEKRRYLMPAYGGFYATLDRAAASVFEQALPGVTVVPILCGESQRRVGAIHCSVAAYPRTAE